MVPKWSERNGKLIYCYFGLKLLRSTILFCTLENGLASEIIRIFIYMNFKFCKPNNPHENMNNVLVVPFKLILCFNGRIHSILPHNVNKIKTILQMYSLQPVDNPILSIIRFL